MNPIHIQRIKIFVKKDSLCPIFQVKYIISQAETNLKDQYEMLMKGGVILIEINWDCDLDFADVCIPKYTFKRFDSTNSNTATGFNFR